MKPIIVIAILIAYIVIAIFLNPLFRKWLHERENKSDSLKGRELEGSVFASIIWPMFLVFTILVLIIVFFGPLAKYIYRFVKKVFKREKK